MKKKLHLYYFSGTGNARSVAHWISEEFLAAGVESKVMNIAELERRKVIDFDKDTLLGFSSPTHGFNFPPIMLHFFFRLPRGKGASAFIVNTRAGMKLGKLFLPGLSGIAQLLAALILILKGYKVVGMKPIDLPSNWISLHPGIKPKVVDSIYRKRKQQTVVFAQKLLQNKKVYRALWSFPIDLLIAPIAVGYYFIGRFFIAKTFFANSDCNVCKLCINKCPIKAIKLTDNRPFWTLNCESCMKCMNYCPKKAIETAHSLVFGVFFGLNYLVTFLIYQQFHFDQFLLRYFSEIITENIIYIVDWGIVLLLFLVVYRLMHFFLRFKFFSKIIQYTSLTTYKFWRRYKTPATKF